MLYLAYSSTYASPNWPATGALTTDEGSKDKSCENIRLMYYYFTFFKYVSFNLVHQTFSDKMFRL